MKEKEGTTPEAEKKERQYYAFISYRDREKDYEMVKWLKRKLTHYHLSSTYRKEHPEHPKEIKPIFEYKSEMAGGYLWPEIQRALRNSRYLIVVCTPNTPGSDAVGNEIEYFRSLDKQDKIIPLVAEGEAFSTDSKKECFPEPLRNIEPKVRGISVNEMGRDAAAIKVIAQMLGEDFDNLWQQDVRERRRKRIGIFLGMLLLVLASCLVAFNMYQKNQLLMERQSLLVAEKAMQLSATGRGYLAQLLALNVLPENLADPERPMVTEAEAALRTATSTECLLLDENNTRNAVVAVSPDGRFAVTGSYDGEAKLWEVTTGACVKTLPTKDLYDAAFSPDQRHLLVLRGWGGYSADDPEEFRQIELWDIESGTCVKTLKGHTATVRRARFSKDGQQILSTSWDGTVRLWNVADGKCVQVIKEGTHKTRRGSKEMERTQPSMSLALSPDGKHILTSFADNNIEIWDAATGIRTDSLVGHDSTIWSMDYHPGGSMIASASSDRTVCLWDVLHHQPRMVLEGHTGDVWDLSFTRDGRWLATASSDSTARIWNVATGRCERTIRLSGSVMRARFSPDGQYVLLALNDHTVRVWRWRLCESFLAVNDGMRADATFVLNGDTIVDVNFTKAVFSPDGEWVVMRPFSASDLRLWNVAKGSFHATLHDTRMVQPLAFTPDGKRLVTAGSGNMGYRNKAANLQVWDVETIDLLKTIPLQNGSLMIGALQHAAFSADGKQIVVAADSTISIWNIETGECTKTCHRQCEYRSLDGPIAWSPDARLVATVDGSMDAFGLFDMQTGKEVHHFRGHEGNVSDFAFSPDGKFLASASYDGTIILWNTADGKRVNTLKGDNKPTPESICFTPEGTRLFAANSDGTVKCWDLASGICLCTYRGEPGRMLACHFNPKTHRLTAASDAGWVYKWDFPLLQDLVDRTRQQLKGRQLTPEEQRKYHFE